MAASLRHCGSLNKKFLNAINCSKTTFNTVSNTVLRKELCVRNLSSCHASWSGISTLNQARDTSFVKVLGVRCLGTGVASRPVLNDITDDLKPKTSVPDGYIIDTPPIPLAETTQEAFSLPELTALGEPTLQSMGFASGSWYSFIGNYQSLLQYVHVTLDVPWWVAVVLLSVSARILLIPVFIWQKKSLVNHSNIFPKSMELKMRLEDAKARGNAYETHLYSSDYSEYLRNNPYSRMGMFLGPFMQAPIFMTVYFSLLRMCSFPVEGLKTGGYWWFLDLTEPDPYYILPFITSASLALMLEFGVDSQKVGEKSFWMKCFARTIPVLVFFFMSRFSSAMALHWMTNNMFSLAQNQVFRIKKVQTALGIPDAKNTKKGPVDNKNVSSVIESLKSYRAQRQLEDRKAVASMSFKDAGEGPIPKTYSYDPTKKKLTMS